MKKLSNSPVNWANSTSPSPPDDGLGLYGLDHGSTFEPAYPKGGLATMLPPPCKHKVLTFNGLNITGGSCIDPPKGFDIYVGLDLAMTAGMAYPWQIASNEGSYKAEICFPIRNFHAPDDPKLFRGLVGYLGNRLQHGLTVHAGCMAGHGRTGTLLAALVARYGTTAQQADPISYVRAHYCKKAVECPEQVDFLVKHYGAKPVPSRYPRAGRAFKDLT